MQSKAVQKFIRTSPRKLRLVVSMIKEMDPITASETLPFVKKRAAGPLKKVIDSAIANAKVKKMDPSELVFKEIQVNKGPVMKRWRAGARGRAKPYERMMSHLRVILEEKTKEREEPVKKQKTNKTEKNIKKANKKVKSRQKQKKAKTKKNANKKKGVKAKAKK